MNEGKLGRVRYDIISGWTRFYLSDIGYDLYHKARKYLLAYYKHDYKYGVLTNAFSKYQEGIEFLEKEITKFRRKFKITKKEQKLLEKEWNYYIRSEFMWEIINRFIDEEELYKILYR